jgi:hypothetical protein
VRDARCVTICCANAGGDAVRDETIVAAAAECLTDAARSADKRILRRPGTV